MSRYLKMKVQNTQASLNYQLRYYNLMFKGIIRLRPKVVVDQQNVLHHVLLLGDLFEPDSSPPRILSITSLQVSFLIQEWLSFMVCNYLGAYSAASRTLRWIYESTLASTLALINPSSLRNKPTRNPLTETEFREWLLQYDNREVRFSLKQAIRSIGLPLRDQIRYNGLYGMLCKYSHVSGKHFKGPEPTPDLVFNRKHFDTVSRYAYRTMDLAIFCIIKSVTSQWLSDGVKGFFDGYLDWFNASHAYAIRRERMPLTVRLLQSLPKP